MASGRSKCWQLKKLANPPFGEFTKEPHIGLETELYHLRNLGYVVLKEGTVRSIHDIPDGKHEELSDYVEITPKGRKYVQLREQYAFEEQTTHVRAPDLISSTTVPPQRSRPRLRPHDRIVSILCHHFLREADPLFGSTRPGPRSQPQNSAARGLIIELRKQAERFRQMTAIKSGKQTASGR